MTNTSGLKRGFNYDVANSRLNLYVDGTLIARFDPTNGLVTVVDGFNLAGQTISTVNASGSADYTTMIAAYSGGAGVADEGAKYMAKIAVNGTDYYVPAFTSVA